MKNTPAFYYQHLANEHNDPRSTLLIEELGMEGYGIQILLFEILCAQPQYKYPLKLIPSIARKYNTTTAKVDVVIKNYNLFKIDSKNFFFSQELRNKMKKLDDKRKVLKASGKRGGKASALSRKRASEDKLKELEALQNKPKLSYVDSSKANAEATLKQERRGEPSLRSLKSESECVRLLKKYKNRILINDNQEELEIVDITFDEEISLMVVKLILENGKEGKMEYKIQNEATFSEIDKNWENILKQE